MTELTCQKHMFSLPDDITYLNSAYMTPLPNATRDATLAGLAMRIVPTGITPDDFFVHADQVRVMAGRMLNADPERIAIVPTAAWGASIIANNLTPVKGGNVVMLADSFPSNVYPWRQWQSQGVSIRMIAAPPVPLEQRSAAWTEAVLEAIDANTLLVAMEQAHWTDGTLFDLVAIGARARAVGAAYVVDATQTMGAYPMDAQAIGADALIAHCYKSMCCHYGLGFAVISERFIKGQPFEHSWLLRKGAQDFSRLVDYQDEFAPGARRFDTSLRSNPMLIYALKASFELMLGWGAQNITDYTRRISRRFCEQVAELGYATAPEHQRAGNIFGLHLQRPGDLNGIRLALQEKKIYVSVRGSAIRVSPHVYNDEADFAKLLEALRA